MSATIATSATGAPREKVLCHHCGLAVPEGLVEDHATHQFCCNGCRTVYAILKDSGLDGYYKVRDAVDAPAQQPSTTGSAFEEFDDQAYGTAHVRAQPDGTCATELLVEGMHCAACVWLIERLPRVAPGVIEARANIRSRTVSLRYDPQRTTLSLVARALDRLGYAPHPARGEAARRVRQKEDRAFLIRVAVAGALAGNIMLLAIALYGGALSGIADFWWSVFRYYSMGLGVLTLVWPGRVFFTGAIAALRTRTAHLDVPIALALLVGGVWGTLNTIRGTGEIYFDSVAVLVFLLLVGRWIQHRQQRAAADSIELMLTLTPTSATLVDAGGNTKRVPIESVEPGMLLRVQAGDSIPADGVITLGTTTLDTSLLTGESRPIRSDIGDEVLAGATNMSSPITMRVDQVGSSTRVGKLMELVARASSEKSEIVRFADRIAGIFVIVVIILAATTVAFWSVRGSINDAIEHATALLIVTCPCALGLATPMAMSVALGRAARRGMLAKSAASIEALAKPGTMILDKTGTLTEGATRAASVWGDPVLIERAASVERHSNHPIARAIASLTEHPAPVESIVQHTGEGIEGIVASERVRVGSPRFIESKTPIDEQTRAQIDSVLDHGHTPIVVHSESLGFGVVGVGDTVRADSRRAIDELRSLGWTTRICSGDHEQIVERVARELGIDQAQGRIDPEGKADLVRSLKAAQTPKDGPVVMVGDGVNDSAALARADVGIAVHGGAEASLQASDLYLVHPGLSPIVDLVRLSRSTMSTIRLCLVISICYNAVAASLAMMGLISALIAAIIMPISSLTVVAICTRAGRITGMRGSEP